MMGAMRSIMSSSIQCKLQYCYATMHDLYAQYAMNLQTNPSQTSAQRICISTFEFCFVM